MTHNQHTTTTIQVQMSGRTVLDCIMHKLPKTRKNYRVYLFVPDNGIPIIEYRQTNNSKKPKKSIQFVDLLFADKRHDINEKFAFSIYTIDKTITLLAQDETTMNEWLSKIKELHSNLYPEFKRYDAIFEANLLDKGLAKTMNIQGPYRLALCKESLDLIPLLTAPHLLSQQQLQQQQLFNTNTIINATNNANNMNNNNNNNTKLTTSTTNHQSTIPNNNDNNIITNNSSISSILNHGHHHHHHHHYNQSNHHHHQRFNKRHPLLSSKTIELVLRSIRRCGHTDSNFYIESGRHSQVGEGDLWMALNKKSTARQLHELLLATMKLASTSEDQFIYKTPRSRSGSSSENAQRSQQSRSSSLICLATLTTAAAAVASAASVASQPVTTTTSTTTNNNININNNNSNNNNNDIDEDSGYLPMA